MRLRLLAQAEADPGKANELIRRGLFLLGLAMARAGKALVRRFGVSTRRK